MKRPTMIVFGILAMVIAIGMMVYIKTDWKDQRVCVEMGSLISGGWVEVQYSKEGIVKDDVQIVCPGGDAEGSQGDVKVYFEPLNPGNVEVTVIKYVFDGTVDYERKVAFQVDKDLEIHEKKKLK